MKKYLLTMCLLVLMAGCVSSPDPVTGEKTYGVDPNTGAKVEQLVDFAAMALGVGAAIWPFLYPFAMATAGGLAVWRQKKKQLTTLQTKEYVAHTAGEVTILGVEEFKKAFPDQWEGLASIFEKQLEKIVDAKDRLRIENFVRGLRGLPPIQ